MKKKWPALLVVAVLTAVVLPLAHTMTPAKVNARVMVSDGNVTPTYPTEVGPGKWALANFSGKFWVALARESGRIVLQIRPLEGYRLEEVRVVVPVRYGANLKIKPPLVGRTVVHLEGDSYVVESKDFGDLGKGQIVLAFFEGTPRTSALMEVHVRVKRGLRSYTGDWAFFIRNPSG